MEVVLVGRAARSRPLPVEVGCSSRGSSRRGRTWRRSGPPRHGRREGRRSGAQSVARAARAGATVGDLRRATRGQPEGYPCRPRTSSLSMLKAIRSASRGRFAQRAGGGPRGAPGRTERRPPPPSATTRTPTRPPGGAWPTDSPSAPSAAPEGPSSTSPSSVSAGKTSPKADRGPVDCSRGATKRGAGSVRSSSCPEGDVQTAHLPEPRPETSKPPWAAAGPLQRASRVATRTNRRGSMEPGSLSPVRGRNSAYQKKMRRTGPEPGDVAAFLRRLGFLPARRQLPGEEDEHGPLTERIDWTCCLAVPRTRNSTCRRTSVAHRGAI